MTEKFTYLLFPKGEWAEALLMAFKLANLDLSKKDKRSSTFSFVAQGLPIIFEECRSKDMWQSFIQDSDVIAKGGFLGTDVAVEQGINGYDQAFQAEMALQQGITDRYDLKSESPIFSRSWQLPLMGEQNPLGITPFVYLGSTPRLRENGGSDVKSVPAEVSSLRNTTIYTEYPSITAMFLGNRPNTFSTRIKAVNGGSEYKWKIDPNNGAVVTIRSSGSTMAANQIEKMADILPIKLTYVEGKMSEQDKLRVDDLREKLFLAARQQT